MINPEWKVLSKESDIEYEGCMSVPSIRGKVERYTNIELTYYNEKGEKVVKELKGFFARLIQHECDHLNGVMFIEKVKGPKGFATIENIKKYSLRELPCDKNTRKNRILVTGAILSSDNSSIEIYEKINSLIDCSKYLISSPLDTMKFKGNDMERYERATRKKYESIDSMTEFAEWFNLQFGTDLSCK